MFGSLVVCLPSRHEGGQLIVRHGEEEEEEQRNMTFDWGQSAEPKFTPVPLLLTHLYAFLLSDHGLLALFLLFTKGGQPFSLTVSTKSCQ